MLQHHTLLPRYIDKVFFDKGSKQSKESEAFDAGEFRVVAIAADNNFLCERLSGDGDKNQEFDMTYAIKRIRAYEEEWVLCT